ncbi:MAG TPA: GntR family transcriptional regulator [Acidobacteriota bacterium]|nr:GntR family transcriptional regulator [Acidobacteriota bacterium]
MIKIDERSPVPIFEQVKSGFRGLFARGLLKPGDQIPAIRTLAETLLVNPNTIARAYRELIQEGFLESRRGEGNFIALNARENVHNGLELARQNFKNSIQMARRSGLNWKEIQSIVARTRGEKE